MPVDESRYGRKDVAKKWDRASRVKGSSASAIHKLKQRVMSATLGIESAPSSGESIVRTCDDNWKKAKNVKLLNSKPAPSAKGHNSGVVRGSLGIAGTNSARAEAAASVSGEEIELIKLAKLDKTWTKAKKLSRTAHVAPAHHSERAQILNNSMGIQNSIAPDSDNLEALQSRMKKADGLIKTSIWTAHQKKDKIIEGSLEIGGSYKDVDNSIEDRLTRASQVTRAAPTSKTSGKVAPHSQRKDLLDGVIGNQRNSDDKMDIELKGKLSRIDHQKAKPIRAKPTTKGSSDIQTESKVTPRTAPDSISSAFSARKAATGQLLPVKDQLNRKIKS